MPVLALFRTYGLTAILAAGIFYFGFHMLTGPRGVLSSHQRAATLAEKSLELAKLRQERTELDARAKLLSDQSLSADLLEERARSLLGYVGPRDYVIRVQHQPG
ncbi:septum formation initiator family protein [soil metagenome]